ncbi:MAG: exodeoxyribonuclease VII large subunit [Clostridiales bacterium]|nr:exodeoxyribonuclease VII large subunit [Clostridiales bacterium]
MFLKIFTVTQINSYIKKMFNADAILNHVSVKGEISNFKLHYSGHMYFTLKDDGAKIKCVMFKNYCSNLKFMPEDGMSVIVSGNISLYERDGQYQIYVENMQPDGIGALYIAYEQLKKKLEAEGIFDRQHKKPIPKFPSKVGVVTSSTGAAVRDIINILSRRYPGIEILIVPVLVQGDGAAYEISEAIEELNKRNDIDVIIVGRGGGSIEELWAFNEEATARAIYESRIPVISAVGHETDFTIADFAADLRAPTPSAAAELCVPDKNDIIYKLNICLNSLFNIMLTYIDEKKSALNQCREMIKAFNPALFINQKRQYIDSLNSKLVSSIKYKIDLYNELIKKYCTNLNILSPLSIISRGYSITYTEELDVVDDIKKVKVGDNINILVKNGYLDCTINELKEGNVNGREKNK